MWVITSSFWNEHTKMLQKTQLLHWDWGKTYRKGLKGYRKDLNPSNVLVVVHLFTFGHIFSLQINTEIIGFSDSGLVCASHVFAWSSELFIAHALSGWRSIGWGVCVPNLVGIGCGLVASTTVILGFIWVCVSALPHVLHWSLGSSSLWFALASCY